MWLVCSGVVCVVHVCVESALTLSSNGCLNSKMAADSGMDTCPSPEIADSRKRPLDGDNENGDTKRSHFSTGNTSEFKHDSAWLKRYDNYVCIGFLTWCITGNNDVCDAVISSQVIARFIRNRLALCVGVRTRIHNKKNLRYCRGRCCVCAFVHFCVRNTGR